MQHHRTGTPDAPPIIILTRAERDTLRARILLQTADGDAPLSGLHAGDIDQAQADRREYEMLFRLLDDLGWHPDDPRPAFPIRSASLAQLERLLADARADMTLTIDDDRKHIAALGAGPGLDQARAALASDHDDLQRIKAILARLADACPAKPEAESGWPRCENCRAPAAYWHPYPSGREPICERCARRNADRDSGAAMAAGNLLGAAVDQLLLAGLADDEIRAALESALREPGLHDHAHAWAGANGLEHDPRFIPITEEA